MTTRQLGSLDDAPADCPIKAPQPDVKYQGGLPELVVRRIGLDRDGQFVQTVGCAGAYESVLWGLTSFLAKPCGRRCVILVE